MYLISCDKRAGQITLDLNFTESYSLFLTTWIEKTPKGTIRQLGAPLWMFEVNLSDFSTRLRTRTKESLASA